MLNCCLHILKKRINRLLVINHHQLKACLLLYASKYFGCHIAVMCKYATQ